MKATIAATIAITAVVAALAGAPAGAATSSSACTATSGVTVIVDFTHFAGGKIERGCAPGHPVNGLAALHAAGFGSAGTAQYGDAFVCRIDGLPTPKQDACAITPSPNAYWAYWYADPTDTKWTYGTVGVLDFHPKAGSIEAFAFGSHALPGVAPSAAVPTTTTTTTTPTTIATPPTPPPPPPVAPATLPPAPDTTDVPVVALGSTTSTTARPAPRSTTTTATTHTPSSTSSTVRIVDRSASGPAPHESSGSPIAVILTIVIVGGLATGAFAFSRARRRTPE